MNDEETREAEAALALAILQSTKEFLRKRGGLVDEATQERLQEVARAGTAAAVVSYAMFG